MGLPREIAKLPERSFRTILGGSAMGLATFFGITTFGRLGRQADRRGSALLLTALALIPLFAMVAFAVDYGRLCLAKAELQRAADAAALAGAQELFKSQKPGSQLTPEEAVEEARKAAMEYAELNTAFGKALSLQAADIEIGYLADASAPDAKLDTSNPALFNAVRIQVRRDAENNGAIPMTFARILGKNSANARARATAAFVNRVAGFQAPPVETAPHVPILPFALDQETWQAAVGGQAADEWAWDAELQQVVRGSDGILECNLYPLKGSNNGDDLSDHGRGQGSDPTKHDSPAADRGTVNIGTAHYSKSHLVRQILFGISQEDWEFHNGSLTFDENGELFLGGKRGVASSLKRPLTAVRGETRIIPIFSKVEGKGENTVYTIVEWAGIRILDVKLNGPNKQIIVQPAEVVTGGTVTGDRARSMYVYSRVWLAK